MNKTSQDNGPSLGLFLTVASLLAILTASHLAEEQNSPAPAALNGRTPASIKRSEKIVPLATKVIKSKESKNKSDFE